ncbi:MAG: hypothetical protein Q8P21_01200 [bacterium]|nr:hypothetical protein [bacterium]
MADKPPKPPEAQTDEKTVGQIMYLLAGLLLLGAVASGVMNYIDNLRFGTGASLLDQAVNFFLERIWPLWTIIAAILSIFAFVGIVYSYLKLREIDIEEQKIFGEVPVSSLADELTTVEPKDERWEKVMAYANSSNPSDWRLAIIEADVILEELLRKRGYTGDSVGEMLKSVDKSDFLSLNDAWEAHKVRNAIAHTGGNFQLNERETGRVIGLFEKVLKELKAV